MKSKYYEGQNLNGKIVATIWHDSINYLIKYTNGSFEEFKK